MEIVFSPEAEEDLKFWIKTGNKRVLKKISQLIDGILKNPFSGVGKPEALKHNLSGKWSRRISLDHRLIYEISNEKVLIYSLKGHY